MKTISFAFFFFLFLFLPLSAEFKEADSLISATKNLPDAKKLTVWRKFCFDRCTQRPHEVLWLAPKAIELAKKLKKKNVQAALLRQYGCAYYATGELKSGYKYCHDAYSLAMAIRDTAVMSDALNDLGIICRYWGAYDMAGIYLKKKIRLTNGKDSLGMAQGYLNLANVYKDMARMEESENYCYRALHLAKKMRSRVGEAIIYANLASLAQEGKKYYEAIAYLNTAEKIFRELKSFPYEISQMQVLKIKIYMDKGDMETAERISREAIAEIGGSEFDHSVSAVYIAYADVLMKKKLYKEALQYIEQGFALLKGNEYIIEKYEAYERLKDIYYELGDIKNGYAAYAKYAELGDSLARQKTQYRAEFLEAEYDSRLKGREIKALTLGGKIKTWLIILLAFSVLLALFFIFLLWKKARQLRRMAQEMNLKNENLNQMNTRLQDANASKEKFFSIIAHDLINPVTVLSNDTKFLTRSSMDLNSKQAKILLDDLQNSAATLKDFVENLLLWSRSSNNKIPFNPHVYNLRDTVANAASVIQGQAKEKHIVMDMNVPSGAEAVFDINMITTVLRNLISNAIKFSPEGGKIRIDAEESGDDYKISVKDYGVGISEEDQAKLFRTDVHHTTIGTSKEKGTGLGLILCKEFIDKHGGVISVESAPGEGTRFIFTLPRA